MSPLPSTTIGRTSLSFLGLGVFSADDDDVEDADGLAFAGFLAAGFGDAKGLDDDTGFGAADSRAGDE
jgi:hypothetical protein